MSKSIFQYLFVISLHEVKKLNPFFVDSSCFENYRCYTDREIKTKEEFTVLVQIDENKDAYDNERVGTIKFSGPAQEIIGTYDNLESWMDGHWLPKFNLKGGKIYWVDNSQQVPRSKLPGINRVMVVYYSKTLNTFFNLHIF